MPTTNLDVAVPQATVATSSSTANSDTASVVLPSIIANCEWRLNPTFPKFLTRYDRKFTIDRWFETPEYIVQPLQTSHESSNGPLPQGWKECIHFEGQCFFYHEQKRVLTESWLYDEQEVEKIDHCLAIFDALEQTCPDPVPPHSQLVLEIQPHPDYDWICWYYYADPEHRCIFWFHEVNMAEYLKEVKGGDIRKHTKNFMQAEYWRHFEYFHETQTVGRDVLDELSTIIRYAHTDAQTSTESTVSQSTEDLERLQKGVDDAKGSLDEGGNGFPWIIGRAMYYICQDRYLNYYGQRGARLSRMHSVHKPPEKEKRSLRFRLLSSFLFKGPETHLLEFERIFIDETVMRELWIQLVKKRMSDWVEHSTFGTILLTANVAFLAIPSIDNGDNPPQYRSPAQIASYLSVIFSIGGVILGLVLLRLHRTMERANVNDAVGCLFALNDACQFLKSRCHRERGLEALSVMYSLPYALLMWAMISFMVAFLWMCFISKSVPALIFVISSSVFVLVLVVWCINLVWINDPERWVHVERTGNRFALKSMAKLTRYFRLRKTKDPDVENQISTPPVESEEKQKEQ